MKNKQEIQRKRSQKYKKINGLKKKGLLNKMAQEYKTMDAAKKHELLDRQKQNYTNSNKSKTVDSCIKQSRRVHIIYVVYVTEYYIRNPF